MPGMGGNNVTLTNSLVVALFHHSLFVTSVYWIIAVALGALVAAALSGRLPRFNLSPQGLREPRARSVLRLSFGAIWLFDGFLQFQAGMPLGLGNDIVRPTLAGAPSFLHPLMIHSIHLWNSHPLALATGSAWIEVGLGLALITSNASVGRAAGAVSVGWAGLIWLIGNGAGGAFASGSSLLFGWPGASLLYLVAGLWLALSTPLFERYFSRVTTRALAILFLGAAALQCLPSSEFWHGGDTNALTAMTREMVATPQPVGLAWLVRHGGDVAGTLGGGFNVVAILWLLAVAVGLWRVTAHPARWPYWTLAIGALFIWVVGEDISIFGGLATDVNSAIPLVVLALCASPALASAKPFARRLPEGIRSASGAVVATFATSMVLFSIVSMGVVSASPAENTLYLAQNGQAIAARRAAPGFTLTDQSGHAYSLGEHRGRYTLLTFLDPVCWTDCPLLAAQLKQVRSELGVRAPLDVVAVAANPLHQTRANVRSFIALHQLGDVRNFYFVTGQLVKTRAVWKSYGIGVENEPGSIMSVHSDFMFIIDPQGQLRWIIPDRPLSGIAGQRSTESELVALLRQSGLGSSS